MRQALTGQGTRGGSLRGAGGEAEGPCGYLDAENQEPAEHAPALPPLNGRWRWACELVISRRLVAAPDRVWAGDIHVHRHRRGLAVPGRGDRPVQPLGGGLGIAAGHDARHRHRPVAHGVVQAAPEHLNKQAGLIFHSDRGSQYASHDFRDVLAEYGITSSMSRRGNCWDTQSTIRPSAACGLTRAGTGVMPLR